MESFESWLKASVSHKNANSVMKSIESLRLGQSVTINGKRFTRLVDVRLQPEDVDEALCNEARDWAPRGKKGDGLDSSNGWALHHPLKKMLKYRREVIEPYHEAIESAQAVAAKLKTLQPLDQLRTNRKRKSWSVKPHSASNAEQVFSIEPFLKACFEHSRKHDYAWHCVDELPFGNKQRCDIYLECDACRVVVESKTKNLLHGIGQVLHYNELAKNEIPEYAQRKHLMMVVLAQAPRPSELDTAIKFDVHVWWPDGPPLPNFLNDTEQARRKM